jgi:hypothetical protein
MLRQKATLSAKSCEVGHRVKVRHLPRHAPVDEVSVDELQEVAERARLVHAGVVAVGGDDPGKERPLAQMVDEEPVRFDEQPATLLMGDRGGDEAQHHRDRQRRPHPVLGLGPG